MNDFDAHLRDAIEESENKGKAPVKSGAAKAVFSFIEESEKKEKKKKKTKDKKKKKSGAPKAIFSFGAFVFVVVLGLLAFIALGALAWFKADYTAQNAQERLASKTAVVERDYTRKYHTESQPVVRMPSVAEKNDADTEEKKPSPPPKEDMVDAPVDSSIVADSSVDGALAAAPIMGFYESMGERFLPVKNAKNGSTPFNVYKRPFEKKGKKPLLSIVIDDMGLSKSMTDGLLEHLPPEVSFSFSPYAPRLQFYTEKSRETGHEVWLKLPLETKNFPLSDPGPATILTTASVEQNKSRLTSLLSSTVGYVGFVAQKDHVFSAEDAAVNPSIQEVFTRGLAVLDSNTAPRSFVGKLAAKNKYPYAKTNFWLDGDVTPEAMSRKIEEIVEFSQATGYGVTVMLRPYPASVKMLQKFLNSPAAENFQLAPVSAQVLYGE